jgi:YD repeat-containing protein
MVDNTINLTKGHLVNKQKYQSGFAHHLIIIISIVVVVIGSLGYVYWKNFMQPKVTANNTTSVTKPDGTIVTTKLDADGKTITVTNAPDGTSTTAKPDGTVVVEKVNPDGAVIATETKSDGATTDTVIRQAVTAPETPNVSVTGNGATLVAIYSQFTISGAGAEGYEVFKSTNSSEYAFYNRIAASPAGSSVTMSANAYRGETCGYKVRAYKKDGEVYVYSGFSSPQTLTNSTSPLIATPTISIGGAGAEGDSYGMLLVMADTDDVSGFQMFRSTSGVDGEYTLLEQINDANEFSVTIPIGQTYYYKAKAFVTDGETTLYSDFSTVKSS